MRGTRSPLTRPTRKPSIGGCNRLLEQVFAQGQRTPNRMIYGAAQRKALGAYYTDTAVAALIANWVVRDRDRVLDPSCGDGAFLHAASLCAARAVSITGIEISAVQADETRASMGDDPRVRILTSDFFDIEEGTFDAVIGNPPFIRYQSFVGASREKALFRCARAGVKLESVKQFVGALRCMFVRAACRWRSPGSGAAQ